MPSERIQRQIDRLLDAAESALEQNDWTALRTQATAVLAVDPDNADALSYLAAAERALDAGTGTQPAGSGPDESVPRAFVGGRYQVSRLLGEGAKKRVFQAHDKR